MQNDIRDENYIYMDKCVLTYGAQISSWLVSEIPPKRKSQNRCQVHPTFVLKNKVTFWVIFDQKRPKMTLNSQKYIFELKSICCFVFLTFIS